MDDETRCYVLTDLGLYRWVMGLGPRRCPRLARKGIGNLTRHNL
jgi:hypothetical protein